MTEPTTTDLAFVLRQTNSMTLSCGRKIEVLMSVQKPEIFVVSNVIDDNECQALIRLSLPKMERSTAVGETGGDRAVHPARTSSGTFFHRNANELVDTIDRRIAEIINWPVDHGEGMQILRYEPGQEYKPHYDYFVTDLPEAHKFLGAGGQRIATFLLYLNTPTLGGTTVFPSIGLNVSAVRGNGVFFTYPVADPTSLSLHGGSPVVAGEKWVASKWLRERAYK